MVAFAVLQLVLYVSLFTLARFFFLLGLFVGTSHREMDQQTQRKKHTQTQKLFFLMGMVAAVYFYLEKGKENKGGGVRGWLDWVLGFLNYNGMTVVSE